MKKEEYVRFWIESAEENFASMKRIFEAGEHIWALFIGHLVIEKLLKACCARQLGASVPKIHDLTRLARRAGIELTADQEDDLDRLTLLQANIRYRENRVVLPAKEREARAREHIERIVELRKWLLGVLSK
jgi:HEPN domain-containing protein